MTQSGESQKHQKATLPNIIHSTRATITFGTGNIRTMLKAGKTAQFAAEIRGTTLPSSGLVNPDGRVPDRKGLLQESYCCTQAMRRRP